MIEWALLIWIRTRYLGDVGLGGRDSCFIRTPIGSRLRLRLRSRNFATLLISHLPQELQTELNLTGRGSVGCAGDHARSAIIGPTVVHKAQTRQSEVRMVRDIEKLSTELDAELLRDPWNGCVLHQREIQRHPVRPGDRVAPQVSKKPQRRDRRGAGVKPEIRSP